MISSTNYSLAMENANLINKEKLKTNYQLKLVKEQSVDASERPLVSISCISYNQEKYIKNAIEGFLNQKVEFPVEILIHDDASNDSTAEIIKEYQENYPHLIKAILNKENQFSKGVKCLHANFNFSRSKGEFIATCEGDDYWIDSFKLKSQVDFLKKNHDYSMVSHDAYIGYWNEKGGINTALAIIYRNLAADGPSAFYKLYTRFVDGNFWLSRRLKAKQKGTMNLADVFKMYNDSIFIPTVSILGKGEILRKMPREIFDSPTGHKEHIFWLTMHGKVFHMNHVMAQKINQKYSLTQTKNHKELPGFTKYEDLFSYLNTFLEVELPHRSKQELEFLLNSSQV